MTGIPRLRPSTEDIAMARATAAAEVLLDLEREELPSFPTPSNSMVSAW